MLPELTHTPVLLNEVLQILDPKPSEGVLDCTLGLGGHSSAFLERISPDGRLIALDADSDNMELAKTRLGPFSSRTTFIHTNFAELASLNIPPMDIIFADLGLSSPHLDDSKRGFSFREDAPLDMRYNRTRGITASELLRQSTATELQYIFQEFGELPGSRRLGELLSGQVIKSTGELRQKIEDRFGFGAKVMLPQAFQALRIAVNDELVALQELLRVAPTLLTVGGRLGIISFHSLEDRMVKQAFKMLTESPKDPVTGQKTHQPAFQLLTKKPVEPGEDEVTQNPRARSAKLRVICRISAQMLPLQPK